jgi:site-specific DNA-methyltransferase (adenine-specific)
MVKVATFKARTLGSAEFEGGDMKKEQIGNCTLYLGDCMELMATMPDKSIDLAIVDPPYGIGQDWKKRNRGTKFADTTYKNEQIPDPVYFDELFRVSKNQIIWGYNYFTRILGPTNYLIVWDKMSKNNKAFHYSKGEIAYTSIHVPVNIYSVRWDGCFMGKESGIKKIHPHQKPIDLYRNLLTDYAKPGMKILDTHLGSGSIAIACNEMGFSLIASEIDEDFFQSACNRINQAVSGSS